MPGPISPVGKRFGRLKVIQYSGYKSGARVFLCECSCGNKKVLNGSNVFLGKTRSCGCLASELTKKRNFKHGQSVRGKISPTFRSWVSMLNRCNNKNYPRYPDHGGRGIKVCKPWRIFKNFFSDMGERPKGLTIERKNNSLGYFKSNCIWDTPKNQARNTRRNHIITVRGVTGCISELCELFGKKVDSVKQRIRNGWDSEKAFFKPARAIKKK